ncbi:MAG: hypothetical protein MRK01_05485 [Candidatus Scalindua sp.]|nr:hypothetical protein [Candidatus Scalindua sp.]
MKDKRKICKDRRIVRQRPISSDVTPAFLIEKMDALGIKAIVNLSSGYGVKLDRMLEKFSHYDPGRLMKF